ncbi:hypothetical protein RCL_jg23693.t1 [Rhizophagus clarus]|uniref:Uncharacterized protein n=1 Tax=Rhizophagus clarus TaxID=94130 RepID=A0A8H3L3I0_9GLOM|nr:hypothetical protein RCL_jg23693.t1 [Rhizophagus clarus]
MNFEEIKTCKKKRTRQQIGDDEICEHIEINNDIKSENEVNNEDKNENEEYKNQDNDNKKKCKMRTTTIRTRTIIKKTYKSQLRSWIWAWGKRVDDPQIKPNYYFVCEYVNENVYICNEKVL